eukprot:IDg4750t1
MLSFGNVLLLYLMEKYARFSWNAFWRTQVVRKTLEVSSTSSNDGVAIIFAHLDKSYAVDTTDQLDIDLASFLDYTWQSSITVEPFVAGFHTRLYKISDLKMDAKLKGHLLLRQAGLDSQTRNMIVGASSGKYEVSPISNALRQAFRTILYHTTMNTRKTSRACKGCGKADPDKFTGIVDSGACTSVLGKVTLDAAMKTLRLSSVEDVEPSQRIHRFVDNEDKHLSTFAIKFPLTAMQACVNLKIMSLGLSIHDEYFKVHLESYANHLYLSSNESYSVSSSHHYMPNNSKRSTYYGSSIGSDSEACFGNGSMSTYEPSYVHYSPRESSEDPFDPVEWHPELDQSIKSLLLECNCELALPPYPHPLNPNTRSWYTHRIYADREYFKGEFKSLCDGLGIDLIDLVSNDHEANGSVECTNKIFRIFSRRIRADDQKSSVSEILSEAIYRKNICKGNKLASSFELLYRSKLRVPINYSDLADPVNIEDHHVHESRKRLNRMLRTNVRSKDSIQKGDYVYFCRDSERWIDPAKVVKVDKNVVHVIHGNGVKTSSINRARKTEPQIETLFDHDDDTETQCKSAQSPGSNSAQKPRIDSLDNAPLDTDTTNEGSALSNNNCSDNVKNNGSVKARIVPWGHRESEKSTLRTDAPCMLMECFRLVMSIAAENAWDVGEMEITAAFLQAFGFSRLVFVRPPPEESTSEQLWQLTAAAYGLSDSLVYGTLHQTLLYVKTMVLTVQSLSLHSIVNMRVMVHWVFYWWLKLITTSTLATQTRLKSLKGSYKTNFSVGELEHSQFTVFGCEIIQDADKSVSVRQNSKIDEIDCTLLSSDRG